MAYFFNRSFDIHRYTSFILYMYSYNNTGLQNFVQEYIDCFDVKSAIKIFLSEPIRFKTFFKQI